jgi:hypothetical protein
VARDLLQHAEATRAPVQRRGRALHEVIVVSAQG